MKKIFKTKPIIKTYDNMKALYLDRKEQIMVKTEEFDKKKKLHGNGTRNKRLTSVSTSKDFQLEMGKIVRVTDLQQVFHKQTNKVHPVVRALVQMTSVNSNKTREGLKWIHLDDVRNDFESLSLLTNFLLENV